MVDKVCISMWISSLVIHISTMPFYLSTISVKLSTDLSTSYPHIKVLHRKCLGDLSTISTPLLLLLFFIIINIVVVVIK